MTAKDSGGTISVTKEFAGCPITVIICGDELDKNTLPDAIHAALGLCGAGDNIASIESGMDMANYMRCQGVACYLYSVLKQAFNVVSVEVQSGPDNTD